MKTEFRPDDVFVVSDDFQLIFTVFISIIMVVGVFGNAMVVLVILKTKNMLNSTNIFLSNLAIADLMVLFTWGAESIYDVNALFWHMPDLNGGTCFGIPFVKDTLTYASVLTILAIGFERYYAICQPLRAGYICTKKRAYWICLFVWAIAVLSSSPQLLFTVHTPPTPRELFPLLIWPLCFHKGEDFYLRLRMAYYIITVFVYLFLPLIMLTIIYVIISRHLKVAAAQNVNIAATRHRQPVVTMLAAVIICFFLCHLPYRVRVVLFFVRYTGSLERLLLGTNESLNVLVFCRILIYLHSAINPILYNLMSTRFRAGFKSLICGVVQRCCRRGTSGCLSGVHQHQSHTAEHAV